VHFFKTHLCRRLTFCNDLKHVVPVLCLRLLRVLCPAPRLLLAPVRPKVSLVEVWAVCDDGVFIRTHKYSHATHALLTLLVHVRISSSFIHTCAQKRHKRHRKMSLRDKSHLLNIEPRAFFCICKEKQIFKKLWFCIKTFKKIMKFTGNF